MSDIKVFSGEVNLSGIKRCYVKLQVTVKCPNCECEMERDFDDDYISHPEPNEIADIYFQCDGCDKEYTVPSIIKPATLSIEMDLSKIEED
jgi:hypothetical protein